MTTIETGRETDARIGREVFGWTSSVWSLRLIESEADLRAIEAAGTRWRHGLFSWQAIESGRYGCEIVVEDGNGDMAGEEWYDADGEQVALPHFSTDIAAAWQVVREMERRGATVVYRTYGPRLTRNRVEITGSVGGIDQMWAADADDAPLAICRAALAAMEAKS